MNSIYKILLIAILLTIIIITGCEFFRIYTKEEYMNLWPADPVELTGVVYIQVDSKAVFISGTAENNFDFDNVNAKKRCSPIIFEICNKTTSDYHLTGSPIVAISGDNADDFIINTGSLSNEIKSGSNSSFSITFNSISNLGRSRQAVITIPNDKEEPFVFNIHCKEMSDLIYLTWNVGENTWIPPDYIYNVQITLIGGGGGGGSGTSTPSEYNIYSPATGCGGGGGGAGNVITEDITSEIDTTGQYIIFIGKGGNRGAASPSNELGNNGEDGEASFIQLQTRKITANGGSKGLGAGYILVDESYSSSPGTGGQGNNSGITADDGKNGSSSGGNGGINGYHASNTPASGGQGFRDHANGGSGTNGDVNTGEGEGGGGGLWYWSGNGGSYYSGAGGNGGSGQCIITCLGYKNN